MDFGSVFGGRNGEKSRKNCVEKHAFFGYRFFSVFLRFLAILLGFWDAPGPQKIEKKWEKNRKSIFRRVQFWRRVLGRFWGGFGRILKGFWMDFDGILGRLLKLFQRIWKDGRIFFRRWVWGGFWKGFGRIFGGFLELQTTCWLLFCLCGISSD